MIRLAIALTIFFLGCGFLFQPTRGGGGGGGGTPVACNASIQTGINTAGAGGTVQLAGSSGSPCTYSNQTFTALNNQTIEGDCSSSTGANTILDGAGLSASTALTDGHTSGKTGVTIKCLTVQHYTGTHSANCLNNQLTAWDGWVLVDDTFQDAGCDGVDLKGASTLENSLVQNNGTTGVFSEPDQGGTGSGQLIQGNEITGNGTNDAGVNNTNAGLKEVSDSCNESAIGTQVVTIQWNYVHDNTYAQGIWTDCWSDDPQIIGNTVIANGGPGIMCEISVGCMIEHNVVKGNGTGQFVFAGDIFVASSNLATVGASGAGNFVEVSNSFNKNGGVIVQAQCRGDAPENETSDMNEDNTTIFDGYTAGQGVTGQIDSTNLGGNCSGDYHPTSWTYYTSGANAFQSPSTSDPHWTANAQGYYTNESLTTVKASPYSNEGTPSASTIVTSGISIPTGCLTIGCSSNPF